MTQIKTYVRLGGGGSQKRTRAYMGEGGRKSDYFERTYFLDGPQLEFQVFFALILLSNSTIDMTKDDYQV